MTEIIELSAGDLKLKLAPKAGGSVHSFTRASCGKAQNILRPSPEGQNDPLESGMFPLDYSNRLKVPFTFRGETIDLLANMEGVRWPIHGRSWQNPWEVTDHGSDYAMLTYTHPAGKDGWPWEYKISQRFNLTAEGLEVTMEMENLSDKAMPCSLGLHPYFPSIEDGVDLGARLQVSLDEVYETDEDLIPTGRIAIPNDKNFATGPLVKNMRGLDHGYRGWSSKRAVISWANRDFRVVVEGDEAQDHAVIFTPKGQPFFCFEPVTAATNSIYDEEKFAETGACIIEPGEKFSTTTKFKIEPIPAQA